MKFTVLYRTNVDVQKVAMFNTLEECRNYIGEETKGWKEASADDASDDRHVYFEIADTDKYNRSFLDTDDPDYFDGDFAVEFSKDFYNPEV